MNNDATATPLPLTPQSLTPGFVEALQRRGANGEAIGWTRKNWQRERVDPATWPTLDQLPDDLHAALAIIAGETDEGGNGDFTTALAAAAMAYLGFDRETRKEWAVKAATVGDLRDYHAFQADELAAVGV
jgi:hypothetical protein